MISRPRARRDPFAGCREIRDTPARWKPRARLSDRHISGGGSEGIAELPAIKHGSLHRSTAILQSADRPMR